MTNHNSAHASGDERLNLIDHLARWITWPRFIFAVTMIFFLTTILFPFYWMVSSSFKTYAEIGEVARESGVIMVAVDTLSSSSSVDS